MSLIFVVRELIVNSIYLPHTVCTELGLRALHAIHHNDHDWCCRKVPLLGWLCCGSVTPGGDSSTLTDTAASSQRTVQSTRRATAVQLRLWDTFPLLPSSSTSTEVRTTEDPENFVVIRRSLMTWNQSNYLREIIFEWVGWVDKVTDLWLLWRFLYCGHNPDSKTPVGNTCILSTKHKNVLDPGLMLRTQGG